MSVPRSLHAGSETLDGIAVQCPDIGRISFVEAFEIDAMNARIRNSFGTRPFWKSSKMHDLSLALIPVAISMMSLSCWRCSQAIHAVRTQDKFASHGHSKHIV
jgi:uncharacterized membrane protein YidH (DUF202 family)